MDPNIQYYISSTLESEIVNGQLMPGTLLHQEELADRFGVSRQPVRIALDILGAKGLAERRSNRTVEVSGLHEGAADEAMEIRKLIEPEALKDSIKRLTPQDLLAAKQAQERLEVEDCPEKLAQHDSDFHLALYSQCRNKLLLDLIVQLRLTNQRAYLGQTLGSETRNRYIETHWQLLEAVTEKNSKKAVVILRDHFNLSKDRKK